MKTGKDYAKLVAKLERQPEDQEDVVGMTLLLLVMPQELMV
jgi:hypothetical protein